MEIETKRKHNIDIRGTVYLDTQEQGARVRISDGKQEVWSPAN